MRCRTVAERGKGAVIIGTVFILSIAAIVFSHPGPARGCAFDPEEAIFVPFSPPEAPLEDFVRGKLGVLRPSYARSFLYVAYRNIQGPGFDQEEQKAVLAVWAHRLSRTSDWDGGEGLKQWVALRSTVTDDKTPPGISEPGAKYKALPSAYQSYLNCHDDAFLTASKTIGERIKQFGLRSPMVSEWVKAQDQVFANCSGPAATIPAAPRPESDPLVKADRAYQIASAYFYAGDFDKAVELFGNISGDASSPWKNTASFLIGRALLRKAALSNPEPKNDESASDKEKRESETAKGFAQAEERFRSVLADEAMVSFHPSAQRMLNLIQARTQSPNRRTELAKSLLSPGSANAITQNLCDYTFLMDHTERRADDDMTSWIFNFQNAEEEEGENGGNNANGKAQTAALEFALAKYKENPSSFPWLVASLSRIGTGHPDLPMLLSAAAKVPPDSPAFLTVRYHCARTLIESGERDAARALLDSLLSDEKIGLSRSSRNLFLKLRLRLARSFGDFLRDSLRIPIGLGSGIDVVSYKPYITGLDNPESNYTVDRYSAEILEKGLPLLDEDPCAILNWGLPANLLLQAAKSDILTPTMRLDLTRALWVRAIAMGDEKLSIDLAVILKTIDPILQHHMEFFLAPMDSKEKFFNALLTIMRVPGLRPYITPGFGRLSALEEFDSMRDNWWDADLGSLMKKSENTAGAIEFLSDEEKSAAKRELATLASVGSVYDSVLPKLLDYAREHPTNPSVPEALHRIVLATRFCECTKLSRDAFQLLHKRYPKDPWSKAIKYWY